MDKAQEKFKDGRKGAEQFAAACNSIKTSAEQAGKGAEKGASGLSKFGQSILRIAKYRMIRSVIRNIMSAFSEGLQNVRDYSDGLQGEGRRIADAFNNMSTHTLTMKNQIGSAFAEILVQLMPVVEQIVSLLTRAANVIAQFFAALGGNGKYYKAVDATAQVAKNLGGGAKSAKEIRNTLMGFDVINRLDAPQEPSGGGGGGTANKNNNMFEYTPLDKWTEKLGPLKERLEQLWAVMRDGFTSAWNFIKEHFNFEEFFYNVIDVVQGVVQFITGILSGDWSAAFAGAGLAVQGLGRIVDQVLGLIKAIVDSFFDWIAGSVNSAFDWLEQKTGYSFEALRTFCLGIVTTIRYLFDGLFFSIKQMFDGIITFVSGVFSGDLAKAGAGIVEIIKGVLNAGVTLVELGVNTVINAINGVLAMAEGIIGVLGGAFDLKIEPIQLPRFATGGFPEDGLFLANHGELVGQFSNGNTAVANNEQIISGIERGVYNAMTSALAGQNSGNRDIRVYLDGKEIGAASRRYERQMNRATGVALG